MEILEVTLGRHYEQRARKAILPEFKLDTVNYPWPTIWPESDTVVNGKLLEGLTEEDYIYLDIYEGVDAGLYNRKEVAVLCDGEKLAANVYTPGKLLDSGPKVRVTKKAIGPLPLDPLDAMLNQEWVVNNVGSGNGFANGSGTTSITPPDEGLPFLPSLQNTSLDDEDLDFQGSEEEF